MFLPRTNEHVFCFLRVDGHEVISSPIEHLVRRKLERRKNIAITCIRHINTSVICKHITSSMKHTLGAGEGGGVSSILIEYRSGPKTEP